MGGNSLELIVGTGVETGPTQGTTCHTIIGANLVDFGFVTTAGIRGGAGGRSEGHKDVCPDGIK